MVAEDDLPDRLRGKTEDQIRPLIGGYVTDIYGVAKSVDRMKHTVTGRPAATT